MKAWEIQQAVLTRLLAVAAVTDIVSTRVYDHVPQDATFPYVVLGEDTATPNDTFTDNITEHTVTLHSWSRYRGRKETKQIQAALYGALHRYDLTVDGTAALDCVWEYADSFLDPDGLTRHGVSRFRVTTGEAA